MNPILKQLCDKNARLALVYQTHQDAYLAHTVSGQRWQADPSKENNHQFVNTEMAWDNARDTVITLERGLLDTTQEFLFGQPADAYKAIRRAALHLQRSFDSESEAFRAFSSASSDNTKLREKYETARSEVISRGWGLMDALDTLHCGREITGTGFHAALYFDQAEGLTAKGKPLTPPSPDPLAVRDEAVIETDLDGVPAHNA
jgi:hypothetical protein